MGCEASEKPPTKEGGGLTQEERDNWHQAISLLGCINNKLEILIRHAEAVTDQEINVREGEDEFGN